MSNEGDMIIKVRISALVEIPKMEWQYFAEPYGVLCNDIERNTFEVDLLTLKRFLSFKNDLPQWSEDSAVAFVLFIVGGEKLYGPSKKFVDFSLTSRSSRKKIEYKIHNLHIEIEDGKGTEDFRGAYPTPGDYFEKLPELFRNIN